MEESAGLCFALLLQKEYMMYIQRPKMINTFIVCIFLLDCSLFYIADLPGIVSAYNGTYNKVLIALLSLISAFICFFSNQRYFVDYSFVKKYSLFTLFLAFCLIIHAFIMYPSMGLLSCLRGCDFLFVILLAFPFLNAMDSESSFERILRDLNVIACIWYLILIMQSIAYSANGSIFLTYFSSGSVQTRNDSIRIAMFSLGNIMVYYNFYRIIKEQPKRRVTFNVVQFVLGLYCVIFIQQTRALIFACILSLAVMFLLHSENPLSTLRNYAIVIVVFVILYSTGVISQYIDSFTGSEIKNTLVRQEAINYYLSYWVEHPLLGMGLSNNESLVHGTSGTYYMSDVGLVGMMAKCGIFAFLLYLLILVRWIAIIIRLRKFSAESMKDSVLLVGLLIYFFSPLYSLSFFNSAWSLTVPLSISIFEYMNHKYTEKDFADDNDDAQAVLETKC